MASIAAVSSISVALPLDLTEKNLVKKDTADALVFKTSIKNALVNGASSISTFISSPLFKTIASQDLADLIKTAMAHRSLCVYDLMNTLQSKEILNQDIVEALKFGATYNLPVISLLRSAQFKAISNKDLGKILKIAIEQQSFCVLYDVMHSPKFNDISYQDLGEALKLAAKISLMSMWYLIFHSRFKDISTQNLKESIEIFISCNTNESIAQILVQSVQFKNAMHQDLEKFLKYINDAINTINTMLTPSRLNDVISRGDFIDLTDLFGVNAMKQVLLNVASSTKETVQLNEYLKKILSFAMQHKHTNVVEAIESYLQLTK